MATRTVVEVRYGTVPCTGRCERARQARREQVQREAREAASRYSDVNDACPYPFGTVDGRTFRAAFFLQRAALAAPTQHQP